MPSRTGLVAGAGEMPRQVISACAEQGREVFVIALDEHADPESFARPPDAWIRIGEVGRGLDLLRDAGVSEIVFAGAVRRPSLAGLRPDTVGAKFLAGIGRAFFRDGAVLSAIAEMLEKKGFVVLGPESLASSLRVEARIYGPMRPGASAWRDIERGLEAGRALGRLDIGQAVVIQDDAVLGVEAAEGTDALIDRCGRLARDGAKPVLVKVCKPGQDHRIDLPTIGPRTVRHAATAGLGGVAVEAGRALIVDAEAVEGLAAEAGLFVVGVETPGGA